MPELDADWAHYQPLFKQFDNLELVRRTRPMLAHYTTMSVVKQILETKTIWFSHPLLMNDAEELRFGVNEGHALLVNSDHFRRAAGTEQRTVALWRAFESYYNEFQTSHALDVYILCLSEHEPDDHDGRLSMWRAYGERGDGAALIFATEMLTLNEENAVLNLVKVKYGTRDQRLGELVQVFDEWVRCTNVASFPDDKLHLAAWILYLYLIEFSVSRKHSGFAEEKEWRVIYFGQLDQKRLLSDMCDYHVGARGPEPVFKYTFGAGQHAESSVTLDSLIHRIIVGPTASSPLALAAVERLVTKVQMPGLSNRVVASEIPFRK